MAIYHEDIVDIELESGNIHRSFCAHSIGSADNQANRFGVRVFRNGSPVDLANVSVQGYFRDPNGNNIAITTGNGTSENKAWVVLPQACYNYEGQFTLAIKLIGGGITGTMRIVDGVVDNTNTGGAVAPTGTVPTYQEILAVYDEMLAITEEYETEQKLTKDEIKYDKAHLGTLKEAVCKVSYERKLVGAFEPATVAPYKDIITDSSTRAIFILDDGMVSDKVHIYNDKPDLYQVGVYERAKTDNEYIGYAVAINSTNYMSFVPDSQYHYIVVAKTTSDTEWTAAELDDLTRHVYVYSGAYVNNTIEAQSEIENNLITPDIIHIGKYYSNLGLVDNAVFAYTDLIPVEENKTYYFPFITLGYAWYYKNRSLLGGDYSAEQNTDYPLTYKTLTAPAGAAFLGVSTRSGDVPNMVLSRAFDSKAKTEKAALVPVLKSRIVREPLNWLYNTDFKQNTDGSRLRVQNSPTFDGTCVILPTNGTVFSVDHVTMDKSKTDIFFSVPSGTPEFVCGDCGHYATGGGLSLADGSIGVLFKSNGTAAEIREGTGESGSYATLLETLDISALNIQSGRMFCVSIEKDTINKYIVRIYDAMCPGSVVEGVIEAHQASDENLYSGQIRGWGGPFVRSMSGNIKVYRIQMYSTAPSYPKVAIWGDSYVENMGRNPLCAYGNLLRDALGGNAFLSGRGGATAKQGSRRVAIELNTCAPQYIIYNFGVNDSFSVSVADFKAAIETLVNMAKEKGAEPILITVPRINDGTNDNATWIQSVNPWIRGSGYRYIDVAYALSTGDGVTQDLTKFVGDKTHPNLSGGQAIFNYIKAFLPDLLWR